MTQWYAVGLRYNEIQYDIDSLVQDCSISSANALEILQSCTIHRYHIEYSTEVAEAEYQSEFEITNDTTYLASYGVSIVRIWEKIDSAIIVIVYTWCIYQRGVKCTAIYDSCRYQSITLVSELLPEQCAT